MHDSFHVWTSDALISHSYWREIIESSLSPPILRKILYYPESEREWERDVKRTGKKERLKDKDREGEKMREREREREIHKKREREFGDITPLEALLHEA